MRLSLRTATTADLVAGVLDGTFDGAFVAGPIEHAELDATVAFREELVLVTARRWTSLAALRAGTPESGPTALVFRTGCTYRQRLEQVFTEFGWPSSARFELGTLDGMIGCVAADMGVTLLPRAVVGRNDTVNIHTLNPAQSRVDTLFITRRSAHQYSALQGFAVLPEQQWRGHRRLTPSAATRPGPDRLDQPERPGALQKSVNRTERASAREGEDEPVAAILQRVSHQHRGHREQTEQAQRIHRMSSRVRSAARNVSAIFLQQSNLRCTLPRCGVRSQREHRTQKFLAAAHYYVSMSR